ncbi:hypothetical protein Pla123a_33870 [Posidoniimonas polymericola]|uniref:Lipopolysaccharide-assembly n=2 Tax=Posidoniimonas polymericola TaxID=2528002 RepID=A0A5C5YHE1_9BACT|nr:hypothetical protein Pla123a_33870 [Posidoniimonas polymericola]
MLVGFCLLAVAGCANYQAGSGSLYAPDVHTVYVPMIESESFRRDLGERLTEAVCKEIEQKTPFKVVGDPSADSVLTIRLRPDARRVVAEDGLDQARYLENELSAEVSWINRRRLPIMPSQSMPLPGGLTEVQESSLLIPAAGQTVASQQQAAIHRLAEQIVGLMEEPW